MKELYQKMMEAGYSFHDIDESDYFGALEMLSSTPRKVISAEEFFDTI